MLSEPQISQIEYEIHETLGEGLNSRVYRASRKVSEGFFAEQVALKVFKSKNSDQILKTDYQSLASVHSPYCVRVLGFEAFQGHPALILELVQGVSLLDLALSCKLTARQLMTIAAQVLKGLTDLHRQGFFHGDLSPGNILIDGSGRVKLIDFGLSNIGNGRHIHATPEFIDPNVLKGRPMSPSSDLFSLGEVFRFCSKFISSSRAPEKEFKRLKAPSRFQVTENYESDDDLQGLGKLVRSLQKREFFGEGSTESLILQNELAQETIRKGKKSWLTSLAAMIILGLLLPITSIQTNSSTLLQNTAVLKVRTNKWYRLKINNKPVGYPPITLPIEAGKVLIEWSQKRHRGQRSLTIRPGENIVINDSFFTQ